MKSKGFEELEVWKKAHNLTIEIYKLTKSFPADERFGLVSQMRRASISSGDGGERRYRKRGKKDKLNFYNIAQGSLDELKYYLILSKDIGYINDASRYLTLYDEVIRVLTSYMEKMLREAGSKSDK